MSQVHYEVFRQEPETGSWSLVEVLANRDVALEHARRLLHERRANAVRVVKESFESETGAYVSLKLFEDGQVNTKKKNRKIDEIEGLPLCRTAGDLYTDEARAVIARTLAEWLTRNKLTATELLHSARALERLDSQGTTLQHALQKVAVARAFASELSVTQIIKQLSQLCSSGIRQVYKDERSGLFEGGPAETFRGRAEQLIAEPDAEYRLNGMLAKYLAAASTWDAKLSLLLGLIDVVPERDEARALLVGAIDALIAETLSTAAALAELLGDNADLGHALLSLTALFLGAESDTRSPAGHRLAAFFARDMLTEARAAVATRLLSELKSMKRLSHASWDEELSMLRRLANALVRARGKYLSYEDIIEAFAERSRRIVTHEPLFHLVSDAKTPAEKFERLLKVEEQIIGAENKRELATFVMPLMGAHGFEESLGETVLARLTRAAELQARVLRSGFQDVQKNQLASALDAVAKAIEDKSRLLASLETRVTDPVERVRAIVKLCAAGAFTQGDLLGKARRSAMAALAAPGFLAAYVAIVKQEHGAAPATKAALDALTSELRPLGITAEDALRAVAA
jgi:hypothetical protein